MKVSSGSFRFFPFEITLEAEDALVEEDAGRAGVVGRPGIGRLGVVGTLGVVRLPGVDGTLGVGGGSFYFWTSRPGFLWPK